MGDGFVQLDVVEWWVGMVYGKDGFVFGGVDQYFEVGIGLKLWQGFWGGIDWEGIDIVCYYCGEGCCGVWDEVEGCGLQCGFVVLIVVIGVEVYLVVLYLVLKLEWVSVDGMCGDLCYIGLIDYYCIVLCYFEW